LSSAGAALTEPVAAPDAGPSPAQVPAPAPAATPAWYSTRNDAEFTGYLQNRGLDKKDAAEAAYEAYKAHKAAEKFVGAPAEELVRLPKDPVSQDWNKVYERIGRPANEDGYDFNGVKFPDGTEVDADFAKFVKGAAFRANVTKEGANSLLRELVAHMSKADEAEAANGAAALENERRELAKNWGPNYEANKFIARQGAAKLGIPAEAIEHMEGFVGYQAVMEAFLKAGLAFGEDKFIANRAPGSTGVMTREQAMATMKERRNDSEWGKKLMAGDTTVTNEFNALTEMIAGRNG